MFADGTRLETDIVVFSAGIRPRDELARAAGLAVGERGGIRIDSHCRTTDPRHLRHGRMRAVGGRIFGLVAPGYQMAEVAARHIGGRGQRQFLGADMSTEAQADGRGRGLDRRRARRDAGALSYVYTDERGVYKKLVVSSDRKQLLGAMLVGDAGRLRLAAADGAERHAAARAPGRPDPANGRRLQAGSAWTYLPAGAQICSCNNVTKGDLRAIAAGPRRSAR